MYFTINQENEIGFTGFVVYDLNPEVELVVPDVDLKNKFGYLTGHEDITERNDNKFDILLSSSPGIPNLVNAGKLPEAIADIKGVDTGNQSLTINTVIDMPNENDKSIGEIKTSIFAIDNLPLDNAASGNNAIEYAAITLPKTGYVEYILRCEEFDLETFECVGEGNDINGWEMTEIPFIDNGDTITFNVSHFSAYAGGGTNKTNKASLTIWDNTNKNVFNGNQDKYVLDSVEFFADYQLENGSAVNAVNSAGASGDAKGSVNNGANSGVRCAINFSDGISGEMNFVNPYQLYEFDRTFEQNGMFGYNITCNGNLIGVEEKFAESSIKIKTNGTVTTLLNENETLIQYPAEIGKNVKWKKHVKNINYKKGYLIEVPENATSIKVNKIIDNATTNANFSDKGKENEENENGKKKDTKKGKKEISIEEQLDEVDVEYETEAPKVFEKKSNNYKKTITISAPDELNYQNVLTYTNITEVVEKGNEGAIQLFWHVNNTQVLVEDVEYLDNNNNSYIDMIRWTTPSLGIQTLSNQTYEVTITIINVQSYPFVEGNWTVRFNTTGEANLTIAASNDTNWSNVNESYDLKFLELKCGNNSVNSTWINNSVFVSNYTCNETGYETSKVLTEGKHTIMFNYGNQTVYAFNDATNPPTINSVALNESVMYSNMNVNGTAHYIDNDGDLGTLYFDWFTNKTLKFSEVVTNVANNTRLSLQLNLGNFTRNTNLTLMVRAYDGSTNGTAVNSSVILVQDCGVPYDDYNISQHETICPGTYNLKDAAQRGILIVNASNINITCNTTTFVGNGVNWAIYNAFGFDNVVIKGCTIINYNTGIGLNTGSNNNNIYGNTITTNVTDGIALVSADFNWIENNTIITGATSGINIDANSDNTTVIRNTITSAGAQGIYLLGDHSNITNNTFYNNTQEGIDIDSSASINTLIWGNLFLGNNNDGIEDSGTNTDFCVNNIYGNYYDIKVDYGAVIENDCGPAPNATVWLYDKSVQYNWSWGSVGTATFNNLREAVYNTENNRTIKGFPESGTFWYNDTDTVRSNITLDCNGVLFDDKATSEAAIAFRGEKEWIIKNCTFNRYGSTIYFDATDYNNTIVNNTFLSSTTQSIYLLGDHNNITNNTFYNNTQEGIDIDSSAAINNLIWGNLFLGNNNDGIEDSGTNTDFCVNNLYGNYYDIKVDYGAVMENDCGPAPNSTVWLYDKSAQYNWSWGSTGAVTFNNLREAVYNTENNRTIKGFPESGTFWYNDTDTVRSNITLDCNGILFDDKATSETAITFRGDVNWFIKNCTFNRYGSTIYLSATDYNNTIINNTLLSSTLEGIYLIGDHNNITNNTFFNSTQEGIDIDSSGAINNLIWGNRFLGLSNDGIQDSGIGSNLCVNNLYGNYYNGSVDIGGLDVDDCGPVPNATVIIDKNGVTGIAWGTNLSVKDIQEGVYNTWNGSSKLLQILPASGPYNGTVTSFRNNIIINCSNNSLMGGGAGTGITILSNRDIKIQNCTFNNFDTGLSLRGAMYNLIYNNTFLGNDLEAILFTTGVDSFNVIKHNNFTSNNDDAIDGNAPSASSSGNNITENTFDSNTDYAITIASANLANTGIWRNNFRNNRVGTSPYTQVNNIVTTTIFNVSSKGNYWTDYDSAAESCNDVDVDGFCDLPQDNITGGVANDSWAYTSFIVYLPIEIVNTAPTIALSLKPTTAYMNSTLNATANYSDVDNNVGTVHFNWFVNNTILLSTSFASITANANISDNITSGNFSKWSNVTVQATPYDGTVNGTAVNVSVNISNAVPTHNTPVLNSTNMATNDTYQNLTVYNQSVADIDGDGVATIIDWRVNRTSIAVLNMPFEASNNATDNATKFVQDYSSYKGNGTNFGATWNSTGGYDGKGAYSFDGIDDYILTTSKSNFSKSFTIAMWVKPSNFVVAGNRQLLSAGGNMQFIGGGTNTLSFRSLASSNPVIANPFHINTWTFVGVTYNGTDVSVYVNDTITTATRSVGDSNTVTNIGSYLGSSERYNGTLDNVLIFNRSLSSQEMLNLYNSRADLIDAAETNIGDNWSAVLTPNDGTQDGTSKESNGLVILNAVPTITLSLKPTTAYMNSTLNATANYTDTNNDAGTVYFNWFVNNTILLSTSFGSISANANISDNITSGNFSKWSNVTVQATPYDGTVNGTAVNVSVNISNAVPTHNTPVLNSTNMATNDTYQNLTVYNQSVADIDGDGVATIIDWRVNGKSIAALNMPFEANSNATDNNTKFVKDYSKNGNNGTAYNGATWNGASGFDGKGAYQFDGLNDYIELRSITTGNTFTAMAWFKTNETTNAYKSIIYTRATERGFALNIYSTTLNCGGGNSSGSDFNFGVVTSTDYVVDNNWHLGVCLYNGTHYRLFFDGDETGIAATWGYQFSTAVVDIGTTNKIDSTSFNGSIDSAYIFNHSLSPQEISNVYNNRIDLIDSAETNIGDNWSAVLTPNDGTQDGTSKESNGLVIGNANPTITLSLKPTTAYMNSTLNATANYTDTNNDAGTIYFNWFVNNTILLSTSFGSISANANISDNLTSGNFSKWSNVTVQATPFDGTTNGTAVNVSVNISNGVPTHNTPVLNSTNMATNDTYQNLTVYNQSVADIDGDGVATIIDWRVNGSSFAALNMPFEANSNATDNNTKFVKDYSKNGNNGTAYNGATWNGTGGFDGKGAYQFDGLNDYIETRAITTGNTFTAMVWFKTSDASDAHKPFFYTKTGEKGFGMATTSNVLECGGGNSSAGVDHTINKVTYTNNNVIDNNWHFAVCQYNGTSYRLFFDGTEVATPSLWGYESSTSVIRLSGLMTITDASAFNGSLDNVYIFNRSLSPQEILNVYNNRTDLIDAAETNIGDNWSAVLTPNDGTQDGTSKESNGLVIGNANPAITLSLKPTTAYMNSTLNATANYTDTNNDAGIVYFNWFVNNTILLSTSFASISANANISDNITSGNFSKWSNVTVQATPFDGTTNGTAVNVSVNISNAVPTHNTPVLNSTNMATNDTYQNLTVYNQSVADIDGDGVATIIDWRVNRTSIAVLNMPFEASNNATDNASKFVQDYSSYKGNGTNFGATWNSTGGYDGKGAYSFDGIDDYILTTSKSNFSKSFTIAMWVKPSNFVVAGNRQLLSAGANLQFIGGGTNTLSFRSLASSNPIIANPFHINTWTFVGVTYNGTEVSVYVNDTITTVTRSVGDSNTVTNIGSYLGSSERYNGTLDNVLIFNRSLSSQEMLNLYNSRADLIDAAETNIGDNWSAVLTPNDGTQDGTSKESNGLVILNAVPTITLSLKPTTAYMNSTLNATANYTDTNNDAGTIYFNWFVNNTILLSTSFGSISANANISDNITSGNFSKWSNVTVQATPFDGTTNGTAVNVSVNISNAVPTHNTPVLNSTNMATNDTYQNLTVYNQSVADIDGDGVATIIDWRVNTTSIAALNMPFEANSNATDNNTKFVKDYSKNGNNGTAYNGATWNGASGFDGKGAYQFDGLNDYIELRSITTGNTFTAMAWFKTSDVSSAHKAFFYTKTSEKGFGMATIDNTLECGGGNSSVGFDHTINKVTYTNNVVIDGNWHFAVCQYNGTSYRLFFDGAEVATPSLWGYESSTSVIKLSGLMTITDASAFNGSLDNAYIFNRSLSPQEILNLYNNRTDLIDAAETNIGDNWSAVLTPNDGTQDGTSKESNGLVIGNANPTITLSLKPTTAYMNSTLNATANYTDTNNDAGTIYFNWFVNNTILLSTSFGSISANANISDNITSGNFSKWSNVTVQATPYDGTVNGTAVNVSVNISNAVPTHNTPVLNSTNMATNDTYQNLTVYNQSVADIDGDGVATIIDWRVNGSSFAALNMPFEASNNATDNASKFVQDYSTYKNNGTVTNAIWNETGGYDGKGGYEFNGVNSWINAGTGSSLQPTEAVTVSAWIKADVTSGSYDMILGYTNSNSLTVGYSLYLNGNVIRFHVNNYEINVAYKSFTDTTAWHHIVGSYNKSAVRIWVDGVEGTAGASTTSINYTGTSGFGIGATAFSATQYIFNGSIDDVKVYNRTLSTQEILNLYNNRTDLIDAAETNPSSVWQACLTPNDGSSDGTEKCSNNLTINTLPSASSVVVQNAAASATLSASTATLITCYATLTDAGGCSQISNAYGYFYKSNLSQSFSSPSNASNHYSNLSCAVDTQVNPCTGGTDTSAIYNCSFTVQQFAEPTDAGSKFAGTDWTCTIVPSDVEGNGTHANDTIEINTNLAFNFNSSIPFGSLALGATRENITTILNNTGNTIMDIQIDGYGAGDGDGLAMNCTSGNITNSKLKYNLTGPFSYADNEFVWNLTDTAIERDSDTKKYEGAVTAPIIWPTSSIYWGLQIPSSGLSGTCQGTVVLTAVNDPMED